MKYVPKELEGNVNVSRTHPLTELAWLVGGLVTLAAALYLALGFATELAARKMPVEAERWLGLRAMEHFAGEESPALQGRLEGLLESLPEDSPLRRYQFSVRLHPAEEVNAVALPGGNIVVFAGLLKQVRSENELAMVLAHELGHYANRDHLKGLGRGLGLTVTALLLLGPDSSASELVSSLFMSFEARYSQKQEAAADAFGLDLLASRYGHVGGATDFFTRLADQAGGRLPYLLASHPHPRDRIGKLQRLIAGQGFEERGTAALGQDVLEVVEGLE